MSTLLANVADITVDKVALREARTSNEEQWAEFVASIKANGILQPVMCRQVEDELVLVDGRQRYEAAKQLEMEQIPYVLVNPQDASEILELQMTANIQRFDTKPVEYARHLQRLVFHHPERSTQDWANRLNKSITWVSDRLRLNKLHENIQPLVDDGSINVSNAIFLAKLEAEDQLEFVDEAQQLDTEMFAGRVNERKEQRAKEKKGQRAAKTNEFIPVPKRRTMAQIRDHFNQANEMIEATGASPEERQNVDVSGLDYRQGYFAGLAYTLSLDPESIESERAIWQARQEEKARKAAEKSAGAKANAAVTSALSSLLPKGEDGTVLTADEIE